MRDQNELPSYTTLEKAVRTPDLGKKILDTTASLLSASTTESPEVARERLEEAIDAVDAYLHHCMLEGHGGHNFGYIDDRIAKFKEDGGRLTGEERALIAQYFMLCLQAKEQNRFIVGKESSLYKEYEFNKLEAQLKADRAPASNFLSGIADRLGFSNNKLRVGTTRERYELLEAVVKAYVDGPSDKEPYSYRNLIKEIEEVPMNGEIVLVVKERTISGGGMTPEQRSRELGQPVVRVHHPHFSMQNYLHELPQLQQQRSEVIGKFAKMLHLWNVK